MSLSISQSYEKSKSESSLLYTLLTLSSLIFIWGRSWLPFQDLAQWTYQGVIFRDILSNGPLAAHYSLTPYLVPNSLAQFLIGMLTFIVPIAAAPKILMSGYVVLYLYSANTFLKTVGKKSTIPLLFLFNYSIFMGNINNNFALCFFLLAICAFYKGHNSSMWCYALLLFFSHALGVVAFLIFALFQKWTKQLILCCSTLILLMLIYAVAHILNYSSDQPFLLMRSKLFFISPMHYVNRLVRPLLLFIGEVNYLPPLISKLLVIGNLLLIPLLALGLSIKLDKKMKWITLCFALILLFAPDVVANMVGPGKRFALPLLFLLIAPKERFRPLFVTLLIVQHLFLHLYWPLATVRAQNEIAWENSTLLAKYFCSSLFEHAQYYPAALNHQPIETFDTSLVQMR